jgi:hypothetical protein
VVERAVLTDENDDVMYGSSGSWSSGSAVAQVGEVDIFSSNGKG